MAHAFNLAIQLIFQRYPIHWSLGTARPFRWRPAEFWVMEVMLTKPPEHAGKVCVISCRHLPSDLRRELKKSPHRLSAAAKRCEFEVMVAHTNGGARNTLPDFDPWLLRDQFLGLKKKNEVLADFLNKCGEWDGMARFAVKPINEAQTNAFLPQKFWNDRLDLLSRITEGTQNWKSTPMSDIRLSRRAEYPHLFFKTHHCLDAMMHSVTLDLLRGVKFKLCQKPDCRKPFAIESAHKRIYCSQYCGHHESLRKKRGRMALQRRNDSRI